MVGAQQNSLFDCGAGFRRTDPLSSRRAADRQDRGGEASKRASAKRRVLAALRLTPGLSSRELAARHAMDRYLVARRLPDLRRDGLARTLPDDGGDAKWVAVDSHD